MCVYLEVRSCLAIVIPGILYKNKLLFVNEGKNLIKHISKYTPIFMVIYYYIYLNFLLTLHNST